MNFNDATTAEAELDRALDTGDPRTIVRALLTHAWPLYHERYERLAAALSAMPASVLDRNPALAVVHPMTPIRSRTGRSTVPMLNPDDARAMTADELDLMVLVQGVGARISGDVETAVSFAHRLADRLAQVDADSRDRADGPLWFLHHQIGSTYLLAGDTAAALQELATSRQLAQVSQYPWAERLALGRTALAHVVRGSLEEAQRALEQARDLPEPTAAHRNAARATEATAAALIAVELMSDDVEELLSQLEPYDTYELSWPFALLARSRAAMAEHRPYDALEQAKLVRDAHPAQSVSFGTDAVAATQIRAYTAIGDVDRARYLAEADQRPGILTRLAIAHLALHEGNVDAARRALRSIADVSGPAQRAEAVVLSAWADLTNAGDIDGYTARQILRLAAPPARRRLLAGAPRHLIERVRAHLDPADAATLDRAVEGLAHPEVRTRPPLTPSEVRVLSAMRLYSTTAEIAAALHVSPNTVKSQLRSLYRKLGCSTRDEAIMAAARWRLVSPEPGSGSVSREPRSTAAAGARRPVSTPARSARFR
ncbi:LuxR C-terminal-related transcriptional regulator [Microbacterium sp. GXF7504]